MKIKRKRAFKDDDILSLVHCADPIADSKQIAPDEALLKEIVATRRQRSYRRQLTQPKRVLLLAGVAAVLAVGAGVALGKGIINGGTRVANSMADSAGVANPHALVASRANHAAVIEGLKAGEPADALTIGDSSRPFVTRKALLNGQDIAAVTGGGGTGDSVEWLAAAGIVSARVTNVLIVSGDGSTQKVDLSSGSFATEIDPSFKPTAIVAYDNAGKEIGRVPFPEAEAPPIP